MPNDTFASQKYQDPLATLPRVCNPRAVSNGRGPAAEGVAHTILFLANEYYFQIVNNGFFPLNFRSPMIFIPSPTPASLRGGPVDCIGGPVDSEEELRFILSSC